MVPSALHRWREDALEPIADAPSAPLLIADSWRVEDGHVLAISRHAERFDRACRVHGVDTRDFRASAITLLPRVGAWFPRVELVRVARGCELRLRLRPAPDRRETITLATHPRPDARAQPRVKGPELDALLALRDEARGRGADEAVLLSRSGAILEGATTTIAWWERDALCFPPREARLTGVTELVVRELAHERGVEVIEAEATLDDLAEREVWALNALHGIRLATSWIDGPALGARPGRAEAWRAMLRDRRALLNDASESASPEGSA